MECGNLISKERKEILSFNFLIVIIRCLSSVVLCAASTIALKTYSSYSPRPRDSNLGRKHGVTCRSKKAKIVPIGNPRWPPS